MTETEQWVVDCVEELQRLDGQVPPFQVDDETFVRRLIDVYERARVPEWSDVAVWELIQERDRLRADVDRLRAERNIARNIAVAFEQELSQCQ